MQEAISESATARDITTPIGWLGLGFTVGGQTGVIDHINRNPRDNRIANLRDTTQSVNIVNNPPKPRSVSKRKGVSFDPRDRRYYAYIDFEGKRITLGGYACPEEAFKTRLEAERKYYGHTISS